MQRRAGARLRAAWAGVLRQELQRESQARPRLAVWKFASCDGCQLSLLDCEDELLRLAQVVQFANFVEASKQGFPGPYDLSLVEGSITTEHDRQRIADIRASSRILSPSGPARHRAESKRCATAPTSPSLPAALRASRIHPTLATSTPMSAHVKVDYELSAARSAKASCWKSSPRFARSQATGLFARGLRRLQAARDAVPDGDARRSLSWPSHPRRLLQALCPATVAAVLAALAPKKRATRRLWPPTFSAKAASLMSRSAALNSFAGQAPAFVLAESASTAQAAAAPDSTSPWTTTAIPTRQAKASCASRAGAKTRTIHVDYLARVEGEGALYVGDPRRFGRGRTAADFATTALF